MSFFVFFFKGRSRHTRYWRDWISDVCSPDLGPRRRPRGRCPDDPATRRNPNARPAAPRRPPRRRCRRRQAPGPAGTLFWEDVLPGEVGTGPLEDLDLHLRNPQLAPQPDQLSPLVGADALDAAGVDVVLLQPPPQTRLRDAQVMGEIGRAPRRERVQISVVAVSLKKKKRT